MIKINNYIISLFGIGYFYKFQGTLASLFTGLIWLFFTSYFNPGIYFQVLFLFILIFISVLSINKYMPNSDNNDPEEIVIDEACGMIISMLFINLIEPNPSHYSNFIYFLFTFIIFRLLDGAKPSFIYRIQLLNTPFSILLDDIVAGIITFIICFSLRCNYII